MLIRQWSKAIPEAGKHGRTMIEISTLKARCNLSEIVDALSRRELAGLCLFHARSTPSFLCGSLPQQVGWLKTAMRK